MANNYPWVKTGELALCTPSDKYDDCTIELSPDRTHAMVKFCGWRCVYELYVMDLLSHRVQRIDTEITVSVNWIDRHTLLFAHNDHIDPVWISLFDLRTGKHTKIEIDKRVDIFSLQVRGQNVYYFSEFGLYQHNVQTGKSQLVHQNKTYYGFSVCPRQVSVCVHVHYDGDSYFAVWNMHTKTKCVIDSMRNYKIGTEIKWNHTGTRFLIIQNGFFDHEHSLSVWDIHAHPKATLQLSSRKAEFDHRWSPCDQYIVGVNKNQLKVRHSSTLGIHSTMRCTIGADWSRSKHSMITINEARNRYWLDLYRYPWITQCQTLLLGVFAGIVKPKAIYGFPKFLVQFFEKNPGLVRFIGRTICGFKRFQHDHPKKHKEAVDKDVTMFSNLF